MTPLRETPAQTRCDRCDELASASCARCDRPLCEAHEPPADRRCETCEAELERRVKLAKRKGPSELKWRLVGNGGPLLMAVLLLVLTSVGVGLELAFAIATGSVLVGMLSALGWVTSQSMRNQPALERRVRREFLAERPGQRLLGSGEPDE